MQSAIFFTLVQSVAGQTQDSALSGSTLLLLMVAAIASGVAAWAFKQISEFKNSAAAAQTKAEERAEAIREANAIERKLQSSVEDKTDKILKLKKDLTSLRKKSHTYQQENKSLLESHRLEVKKLEASVHAKPAYSKPEDQPVPKKSEHAKPAKSPTAKPQQQEPPTESELVKQLRDELVTAREERGKAVSKFKAGSESFRNAKAAIKELRFRVERYRRVDIMTKNQLELATDKLLTLGRQYYDSVSEVAALKGEVIPPKPKQLRDAESAAAARAATAEREALEAKNAQEQAPVTLDSVDPSDLPEIEVEDNTTINLAANHSENDVDSALSETATSEVTTDAPVPEVQVQT